ncbi:hypothetical protein [Streptomyces sp. NBC_01262]|uniref:hypothetical protein n=1 Tax=Streptomyces sp. NBC_01262 TaxID=2903803 RepID=UPI002E35F818|nr:hypothetical protein [Streptomyces sp. NBC_01262]
MGRRKPNKPRRRRTGTDGMRSDLVVGHFDPAAAAAGYVCGHCLHGPAHHHVDERSGVEHITVMHSATCPVRRGLVDARPDIERSIEAAG